MILHPFLYFSRLSLRSKHSIVIVGTAMICILFSSLIYSFNDLYFTRKNFQREISVIMELMRINSVAPLYFEDSEAAFEALAALKAEQDIAAVALYLPDGTVFADYLRRDSQGHEFQMTYPEKPWEGVTPDLGEVSKLNLVYPVNFKGKTIGYLYCLADLSRYNKLLLWHAVLSLVTILVSVLIALYMSKTLIRPVLGPILHLVRVVQKISHQNDFSVRARFFYHDEIGDLILGFNQMIREIQQRATELHHHRKRLEQTVKERTHDLILVNEQLTGLNQDLLEAKGRAEKASMAKSSFLASMSHELRTPLNGILGYTQLFQRAGANLSPEEKMHINVIRQCGEHLLDMINDILDLSKMEAGKLEVHNRVFPLAGFIHATVAIAQARAGEKGLIITTQVDKHISAYVRGDDHRIRQVLLNLLTNAVKFTTEGNIVLTVSALKTGGIRFEVADTGIGMHPVDLAAIFEAFTQIGDVRHKSAGTGLGLTISRELVELMGGQIFVESTVGVGSRFWFDLPLACPSGESECQEPMAEYAGHITGCRRTGKHLAPFRVLVADDMPDNRAVLRDILSPMGFEIHEAEDGQAAVRACRSKTFDLIFMDLVMPVLNGIEAAQKILAEAGPGAPVIFAVSASISKELGEEAMAAGCARFLSKPIHIDSLFAAMEACLDLEWITASPGLSAVQDAPGLPADLAGELSRLAENGDISGILDWCQVHLDTRTEHNNTVQRVQTLARQFKINEIKALAVLPVKEGM